MKDGIEIVVVDAFTGEPYAGNPAAVCPLEAEAPADWMQRVAAEMNLAETAFTWPERDGTTRLRWFTPTREVDLCGHATLAAAHALWELGRALADAPLRFITRSGILTARPARGPAGEALIELDFPAEVAEEVTPAAVPPLLLEALGARPRWVGRNRMDYLVELADAAAVRALAPDLRALRELEARGVIATAPGEGTASPADAASTTPRGADADFISRCFAPAFGIDEDPVTGSAHCALGPFWAERLGKTRLLGYQASARGGYVQVEPADDRVRLAGQAVTVVRGELLHGPSN